jgi:hypothetical protein
MAKSEIFAGICGLTTTVTAEPKDGMNFTLKVDSECDAYDDLDERLPEASMMAGFDPIGTGPIYEACRAKCKHGACPVPMGIIKTVEVAAGMALPKDVEVTVEK